jgi:hypothetical protein
MNYLRMCNRKIILASAMVLPGIILGLSGVENLINPDRVNAKLLATEITSPRSIEIETSDRVQYYPHSVPSSSLAFGMPRIRRSNTNRSLPSPSVKPTSTSPKIFSYPVPHRTIAPSSRCLKNPPYSGTYKSSPTCPTNPQKM